MKREYDICHLNASGKQLQCGYLTFHRRNSMKTLRLFTILMLTVLVLSMWTPAPVYAKQLGTASTSTTTLIVDLAKVKLARLRVNNRTGGTLYVKFSGERSYSFAASSQGKTTFESVIQPGKYTITVTASTCNGQLTYRKKVRGGTVSLPAFICRRK